MECADEVTKQEKQSTESKGERLTGSQQQNTFSTTADTKVMDNIVTITLSEQNKEDVGGNDILASKLRSSLQVSITALKYQHPSFLILEPQL